MTVKAVLFDLDGTLLPMNMDEFVKDYLKKLSSCFIKHGYEPKMLVDAIWTGTGKMIKNNGKSTNYDVFWECMKDIYGDKAEHDKPLFDEFYKNEFQTVREVCGYNEKASRTVHELKRMGFRTVLATNPVFPSYATESRIRWAGLSADDFELYTTYENSRFAKPNRAYYSDLCEKLSLNPQECLMVGNDAHEDMIAESIGMNVFLITDYLVNSREEDISKYDRGDFDELMRIVNTRYL